MLSRGDAQLFGVVRSLEGDMQVLGWTTVLFCQWILHKVSYSGTKQTVQLFRGSSASQLLDLNNSQISTQSSLIFYRMSSFKLSLKLIYIIKSF